MTSAQWCQAYFLLSAAGIGGLAALPQDTKRPFVDYGARISTHDEPPTGPGKAQTSPLARLAHVLSSWGRVPHAWFVSFYIASTASSAFWAAQFCTHGSILRFIASHHGPGPKPSMTLGQVVAVWALMSIHGLRRLLEHLLVMKTSKSDMWFIHWLFGISFYLCMGVAEWVEGSEAILYGRLGDQAVSAPSARSILAFLLFVLASLGQFWCHRYLASLKKYSLPSDGLFEYIVCPHYTCECLIYLSLAIIAAPGERLLNRTILCGLILVAMNLGVTASGTKEWYTHKFGSQSVESRWAMIPYCV